MGLRFRGSGDHVRIKKRHGHWNLVQHSTFWQIDFPGGNQVAGKIDNFGPLPRRDRTHLCFLEMVGRPRHLNSGRPDFSSQPDQRAH